LQSFLVFKTKRALKLGAKTLFKHNLNKPGLNPGNCPTCLGADALGGNCLTLIVGTLRQGEWEHTATTLHHLALARQARNFPIINHGR
jgi:hypothetical protein